jgi:hypothetical protein
MLDSFQRLTLGHEKLSARAANNKQTAGGIGTGKEQEKSDY